MAGSASPSRIAHIRQRTACDCVIAAVAMVANLPYEAVAELSPVGSAQRGLLPWEIRRLLEDATGIKWRRPARLHFRRFESLCVAEHTLVLLIRQPTNLLVRLWKRLPQHCIAVRKGRIFAPEYGFAVSLEEYARADWVPSVAFRPVDANQLVAMQNHNDKQYRKARLWSEILNP